MADERPTPEAESTEEPLKRGRIWLPPITWRVVFDEGFGWPECERRERTTRRFDNARDAGRMIRTIRGLPTHHQLVAVFETRTEWLEVDPDLLTELIDDDERCER